MNSTLTKILLAYTAGMVTVAVYQDVKILGKFEPVAPTETSELRSDSDTSRSDTTSASSSCACINDDRYNVSPKEDSQNFPISTALDCKAMVNGAAGTPLKVGKEMMTIKGAWFSKVTLDLMFCHKMDANGIFVYEGVKTGESTEPVYIIEAARTNKIVSHDDGTSYMYYSQTMCPTVCGVCGD